MFESLVQVYDEFTKNGRIQDLKQLAKEQRFSFSKRVSFGSQITELKGFKVFAKKGTKRLVGLISQATEGFKGEIRFYDFLRTYELETYTTSVIEIRCDELFAEYLTIQPKGALEKMKGIFVSEEKEFPHLQLFHQNFQISSRSPDASLLLKESVVDLMSQFPGLTFEAEGNYFLFYFRKKEMKIQQIIPNINFAEEFVRLLCFDQEGDFV
jgi:hypothetical protein